MAKDQDLSAGLFIGWKNGFVGREQNAMMLLHQATEFFQGLRKGGEIGSFDVVMLQPYGGDLNGFFLIRGSHGSIEALQRHEVFHSIVGQAMFCLDGFRIVPAMAGESIAQTFSRHLMSAATRTAGTGPSAEAARMVQSGAAACSPEGSRAIAELLHQTTLK